MKIYKFFLISFLFFSFDSSAKRVLPDISFEWDEPLVLCPGGYTRVHSLTDGRLMCSYTYKNNGFIRYSDDNGYSWGAPCMVMKSYEWFNENGSTLVGMHNPETLQLSSSNPYYPERLFYIVNLRPSEKKSSIHPYGIAYVTSDDGGATWSEMKTLFLSEQWNHDVSKGCWEPFLMELPDGTIQMYFSDETPYFKNGDHFQNISVMESHDGGNNWIGPRIVCYTPKFRDGMPSTMIYGKNIYLAIEANNVNVRLHPQILYSPIKDNWSQTVGESSEYRFDPFIEPLSSPDYTTGAPYLTQTEHFIVISYQTSRNADIKVHNQRIMEVQACLKSEIKNNKFQTMRGASHPIDINPQVGHVMWNSLHPLDGDEIMACCQYNGKVTLVRGRIKAK